jgi:hypothetical protein
MMPTKLLIGQIAIVIAVSPELNRALVDYARAYEEAYGEAEGVTELIPTMLQAFLSSDRTFARRRSALGS